MGKPRTTPKAQEGVVPMAPLDFYRLKAAQGDLLAVQQDAHDTLTRLRLELAKRVQAAIEKRNAVLDEMATKYRFNAHDEWTPDDTRCALVRGRTAPPSA